MLEAKYFENLDKVFTRTEFSNIDKEGFFKKLEECNPKIKYITEKEGNIYSITACLEEMENVSYSKEISSLAEDERNNAKMFLKNTLYESLWAIYNNKDRQEKILEKIFNIKTKIKK
ncbi:hypothetical protein CVV26_03150 [Candidatus Kuenenbacteria bacterium HGW-Kuenenbacteria-1]|uniref:Uncharacterized protein n=1 Tax=Candidatus Kuenenbacteria bacterium HGW-Kuenenbacteria-1 TaxID=2013812 RepID=A0A2N1UMX1_9BACT|nr:MAG: hypothetical protein CVV26_03150 [Candidatus Kuenenbacteria bacterium HGW-Kuenenbacteria-1]